MEVLRILIVHFFESIYLKIDGVSPKQNITHLRTVQQIKMLLQLLLLQRYVTAWC